MKFNTVQKSILSTLVFFDIFDRPLTLEELYLYLYKTKASKTILQKEIKELISKGKIGKLGDWYFLPGRLKFLQEYPNKQQLTKKLITKVNKKLWKLKNVPFVQMIAIVNSVAFSVPHKDSDIDILVITRRDRLYTTRFFLIRFLKIFGVHPKTENDVAGKVCTSFLIDKTHLNLDSIKLDNVSDIYLDFWLPALDPVYGQDAYQDFIASNKNILAKFPNFNLKQKHIVDNWYFSDFEQKNWLTRIWEYFFCGLFGDLIERYIAQYYTQQLKQFTKEYSEDSIFTIKKNILKIHSKDRRKKFSKQFQAKIKKLI